jgi:type I restriction enzyme S subunit
MPKNWKTYKLSDTLKIIGGGTPKTSVPEYWDGDIPWLSVKDFQGEKKFVSETEKSITQLGLEKSSTKLLPKDAMIISARGTVGELAVLEREMAFNQSCYGLLPNEKTDRDFLYYLVKQKIRELQGLSYGSVFDTITTKTFDGLDAHIPDLKEQTQIANILSAIDDKIENNLATNKTLEDMAIALYKHWFVDFGPFQDGEFVDSELGPIPKGWEVKSVYSLAQFINGAAFKSKDFVEDIKLGLPVIKIVEIKQGITSQTKYSNKELDPKYIINNNDILFPWSGNPHTSLGIHLWDKGKALLNQHLFVVRVDSSKSKYFVYNTLKNLLPTFINLATHKQTTGLGHVTVSNLKELKIPIGTNKIISEYEKQAKPIMELTYNNQIENQNLTKLRDTILPKLISGEVRLKEFREEVEAII